MKTTDTALDSRARSRRPLACLSACLSILLLAAVGVGCAGDFDVYHEGEGDSSVDGSTGNPDAAGDAGMDGDVDQGPLEDAGMGPFDLDVTVDGTGSGQVVSAPGGIVCGADCTGTYDLGTNVTLIATPASGSVTSAWGGACAGTNPEDACVVSMDRARSVTVTFTIPTYTLTVVYAGAGTGAVSAADASLSCDGSGTCTMDYPIDTEVTLSAAAGAASAFSGWSMDCAGLGDCVLTMDQDRTVGVTFDDNQEVSMLISKAGNGSGLVTSAPAGIDCGADCSAVFSPGQMVTLTAAPDAGSLFMGWSGDCTGTGTTCEVTMSAARSVTATFELQVFTVSVAREGTGEGSVDSVSPGIACGSECTQMYTHGSSVLLVASASEGSSFSGWSGGVCSGTNSLCTVPVMSDTAVTAAFTLNTYPLTAAVTGPGTIVSALGGINCGSDCVETYGHGTVVTLNAVPDEGAAFMGWTGACAGEASTSCMTTITAAASVSASFALNQYTVTASTTDVGSGTITSSVGGINCGATCMATLDHGTAVTFTATEDSGSTFIGWGGACASASGSTCNVTMTENITVSAAFIIGDKFLTVTKTGTGSGSVVSAPAGINCGDTCASSYPNNTMVTLTATPATGSTFTGWSGGGCSGTGTCDVTVNAMITVSAEFTVDQHTLDVTATSVVGGGTGTITSTPAGITCGSGGSDCSVVLNYGSMRTLSAASDANNVFTGWSGGGCSGTGTCVVSVTSDVSVSANFERAPYLLTVGRGGTGSGGVVSDLAGIDCGGDCSETYRHGDVVTLTATPDATSTFNGWSGAGCGLATTCVVTMEQATTVTANFVLKQYSLTVSKAGNGAGTVTGTGISCGSDCSEVVSHGTMVTLTASPSTGSTFTGWSNGCTGTGSCVVSMTQARSVTATFTLNTYTLTVARSGTGSGSVSSNPAGLTCPMSGSCTGTFNHGQAVVLSATPGSDSDFTSWSSSSCPGTGSCTLTITGNTSLTASFTLKQQPLTVTVNGTGSGTVTSSPGTINCMAGGSASACSATYTHGTMVTLTAAATSGGGNTFAAWGGACAGVMTSTCSVSMTQARTVSATFNVGSNNLTVVMDASATGMGTVTSNPAGISCSNTGGDCAENYTFGAMVTLTATPDTGSVFTGWSGGGCPSGSTSPCTVTMDAAKTVTAAFDLRVFTLTANVQSAGFGLVDTTDGVLSCDDSCADDYTYGEVVVIKATPNDGYNFNPATGWSNVCTIVDGGDCQVTMTAARTVTATFTPQIHTVTVQNTGGGSVDSDDGGITCGADCSGSYATGTEVTLTATPAVGYSFSGWTGVCNGEGPTCVFTVTQPETVSPIFTINTYTINASFVSPPGSGLITGASGAINCTSNSSGGCSTSIQHGTQVTLVAQHVAATKTRSGSRFLRWVSGPCASGSTASNPVCSATITGPTSFRAEYIRTWILTIELDAGIFTNNPTVAVTTAGGGTGSNMLCTESLSPCEFELDEGAVGMNAQPSARFRFWTGPPPCGGSNNNICGFAINAPTTYSADFL